MFSFFRKKTPPPPPAVAESIVPPASSQVPSQAPSPEAPPPTAAVPPEEASPADAAVAAVPRSSAPEAAPAPRPGWFDRLKQGLGAAPAPTAAPVPDPAPPPAADLPAAPSPDPATPAVPAPVPAPVPAASAPTAAAPAPVAAPAPAVEPDMAAPVVRTAWLDRLKQGLRKTGTSIATVFTGTRIDEELYDELETALLLADTGVKATAHLLADLRRRVKDAKATEPSQVKGLLVDAVAELLAPVQRPLVIGEQQPTVLMVVGVNGAGKTTSIGKLTHHLAASNQKVLLAAADTFRAAAREQLAVWADRNRVEVVSQAGGDPSAVAFDAVSAGRARGCDVVIVDTAGRLTTQPHLMAELEKIRRVVGKAMTGAPHEVLLVVDGNTGQNALAQVQAFDGSVGLTGLVVTKLDGTAKGGVLCAIALWSREQRGRPLPVYFIGVGEQLEALETFDAREFAQAMLGG